jgi:hypothetical protein
MPQISQRNGTSPNFIWRCQIHQIKLVGVLHVCNLIVCKADECSIEDTPLDVVHIESFIDMVVVKISANIVHKHCEQSSQL